MRYRIFREKTLVIESGTLSGGDYEVLLREIRNLACNKSWRF